MTPSLPSRPWMAMPEIQTVFDALEFGGEEEARFVGGCVRDALLDRRVKDIDIATTAVPDVVIQRLERMAVRVVPTGIEHGTVTAVCGSATFEITTLRRDVETDGRHARVVFSRVWQEDAARRDFTMNALSADRSGAVFDYFGGLTDLENGVVRFVGEAERRIREDVLRILRFFRFFAHYGRGEADAAALSACAAMAPALSTLSGERLRSEILRLLAAEDPIPAWRLMRHHGILSVILPDATNDRRLCRLVAIERRLDEPGLSLRRLAAVLPADRRVAERVSETLRFSAAERERLSILVSPPVGVAASDSRRRLREARYRLERADVYRDVLWLAAADDEALAASALRAALAVDHPGPFPLGGRDLLALGMAPGPAVGAALSALLDWWIAGNFSADRNACLTEAARRFECGKKSEVNPLTTPYPPS